MSFVTRMRRWFDRTGATRPGTSRPADPADLHPGTETPTDGAAQTGLDRPFPSAGPVADPPVADPPVDDRAPAPPPERPMG